MAKADLKDDSVFYALDEAVSHRSGLSLPDIVDRLPAWWDGQGDPVYRLHSMMEDGRVIDDDLVDDASSNVRRTAKKLKGQDKDDGIELADALDALSAAIKKPAKKANLLRAYQDAVIVRNLVARVR